MMHVPDADIGGRAEPELDLMGAGNHHRLRRMATERACASSPSASPSAIAAGASARN
jgi:hypothetical protein